MKIFKNYKKQNIFNNVKCFMERTWYVVMILMCFFPNFTYANSSWRWISDTRPYDVLPFVIIVTLAAETISIIKFSHIENKAKTFVVVLIGNILSFAAPYALTALFLRYNIFIL